MNVAHIPNCITILRLVGTFILIFTEPFTSLFYGVHIFTGLTDAIDGFLARKLKVTSDFGAKLDSVADVFFNCTLIIKILPALIELLPNIIWYAVGLIVALRIASYVIAAVKFRKFSSLHTIMNKIAAVLIFTVPFFIHTSFIVPLCAIICILGILAILEEICIHIMKKEYKSNVMTIVTSDK